MLLLFAGAVMNLVVIAALTAFIALEKLAPFGMHGARVGGVLLIVAEFAPLHLRNIFPTAHRSRTSRS